MRPRRVRPMLAALLVFAAAGSAVGEDMSTSIVGPDAGVVTPADAVAQWSFATVVHPGDVGLCGGSLIAPRWVLTAGHCAYDHAGARLVTFPAFPGANDRSALPPRVVADTSIVHPGYTPSRHEWDFMLLRFPSAGAVQPAILPAPTDDAAISAAQAACIAGWGLATCTPVGTCPTQTCAGPPADRTSEILRTVTGASPSSTSGARPMGRHSSARR